MASQVLGSGFSLPTNTNTLVADEVVAKILTARSGGSSATFPGLITYTREGNERVFSAGVFGGATNMTDRIEPATWSASIAYTQGSWVRVPGVPPAADTYWVRSAAGLSVVGVPPSAPDWQAQVGGYPSNGNNFFNINSQIFPTSTDTTLQTDGKLSAAGVGSAGLLLSTNFVNGAALVPPQPVSWSQGGATINKSLAIEAPGVIAGTAPALSNDASLSLHSISTTGVGTRWDFYGGVGNPGGGAPANSLSLYGYPDAGGLALLFNTTPATTNAYGTAAEPAIFQLSAPQQSGSTTIASGGTSAAAIPIAGLTATSIVMATNCGVVGTGAVDAASAAIADTSSSPGNLILRTNAAVVAAAGITLKWFIVRL